MYRFKQLMAEKISLRNYNGHVGEIMAYVCAMNKLYTLGLPARKPQQQLPFGAGEMKRRRLIWATTPPGGCHNSVDSRVYLKRLNQTYLKDGDKEHCGIR